MPPGDAEEIIAVESEVELDKASCPILEAANRGVGQQDEDIYPEVEDDISTIPPVDAEEITATESDVEQDTDNSPEEVSIDNAYHIKKLTSHCLQALMSS